MVLRLRSNATLKPNLTYGTVEEIEEIEEMPANDEKQIPDLFRYPIWQSPGWADRTVFRIPLPEGSRLVIGSLEKDPKKRKKKKNQKNEN
jgi:hypothetical protein